MDPLHEKEIQVVKKYSESINNIWAREHLETLDINR